MTSDITLSPGDVARLAPVTAPRQLAQADRQALSRYARATWRQGLAQLTTSVLPYLVLLYADYRLLSVSLWLALALAIPMAGFQVRTFIVFHDCTHGSFLPSRRANRWLGAALGVLVLAPFRRWGHDHAVHHATAGDLDHRGTGDVPTLTVEEYAARSPRERLAYRAFRHPVVMFGIGPIFAMMIGPRIFRRSQRPHMRNSVVGTDVSLALAIGLLCWLMGPLNFAIVWLPSSLLAGAAGIWLFYVQHQFEDTVWQSNAEWSYVDAALRGSSYLALPRVLQFLSGNIGLHHVHHLNARIPNYNLQRAHDETALFDGVPVLTLRDGLHAVRLKLWDDNQRRLVTFPEGREIIRRLGLDSVTLS